MADLVNGVFDLILMILFWVVVVAAALWLVSRLFPKASSQRSPQGGEERETYPDSPLEILKQRYARGEISQSEYLDMRNTLRN